MMAAAAVAVENGLVVGVTVQNWPAPSPDTMPFDPVAYAAGLRGYADGQSLEAVCAAPGGAWRRWCVEGWLQAQTVDARRQAVKR